MKNVYEKMSITRAQTAILVSSCSALSQASFFSGEKFVYNYGLWLQAGRNPAEYTEERRELCKAYFMV
jgi:hypothetical protein